MREIALTRGLWAKIDDEDFERVNAFNWCASGKNRTGKFYAARGVRIDGKQRTLYLHHVILPKMDGLVVDHINQDPLDNRRSNLRYATHAQNVLNVKQYTSNTSGKTGVYWSKREERWMARIVVQRYFRSKEEAIKAREEMERLYHGDLVRG